MQIFVFSVDVTRTSINYSMLSITCRCFQRQTFENLHEFQTVGINTRVGEVAMWGRVIRFPKTALQLMRAIGKAADGLEAEKKTETWYQLVSVYNRLYRLEFRGRLLCPNL